MGDFVDGESFASLRPLLFSIAYRMTGSSSDSEDILQEAFLRWQATDAGVVRSPKAFLTTVVSRLALDSLKAAHRKREVYPGPWLPEPLAQPMTEPVELAESLSFAFLHLLEALTPQERVAFLMRDVFDNSYAEVAETLEASEVSVRKLVSRAREHLRERRPKQAVNPETRERLFREFLRACEEGDAGALVELLKEDAVLYTDSGGKRPAARNPIFGADKIVRFILGVRQKGGNGFRGYPAMVNGGPGAVITLHGAEHSVMTLDIEDERIRSVYYVINPEKLEGFLSSVGGVEH